MGLLRCLLPRTATLDVDNAHGREGARSGSGADLPVSMIDQAPADHESAQAQGTTTLLQLPDSVLVYIISMVLGGGQEGAGTHPTPSDATTRTALRLLACCKRMGELVLSAVHRADLSVDLSTRGDVGNLVAWAHAAARDSLALRVVSPVPPTTKQHRTRRLSLGRISGDGGSGSGAAAVDASPADHSPPSTSPLRRLLPHPAAPLPTTVMDRLAAALLPGPSAVLVHLTHLELSLPKGAQVGRRRSVISR